ncbi:unnamed protein product [Effrenium voratum]|nr:unnamed protein product [Effrenium voratum]
MPEYELFYFPITGLGEPIRLAFALGGIPFKDTTPATDETFNDRKAALHPYLPEAGGMPILTIDGKAFAQSRAILRYVGRIAKYEGELLYPTDPMEQLLCDELIEIAEDMRAPIPATFAIQDEEEKKAARAALVAEDGKVAKWLRVLDRKLGESFPTKVTIGALYSWVVVSILRQPTFLDGIPAGHLDKYANITKLPPGNAVADRHQWLAQQPAVLKYYEGKEGQQALTRAEQKVRAEMAAPPKLPLFVRSFLYKFYVSTCLDLAESKAAPAPAVSPEEASAAVSFLAEDRPITHGSQAYVVPSGGLQTTAAATGKDHTPLEEENRAPVGQPLMHRSALPQCTGEAKYTDDMPKLPGTLHGVFVLSERPHAKILPGHLRL